MQSLYLWDNPAFLASDSALPSFAVPLGNDNHSFSLNFFSKIIIIDTVGNYH